MYDLVNLYKGLTEKQRQDLNLESSEDYFVIEKEKLEQMELEVEAANQKRLNEEKRYEESIIRQAKEIQDREFEIKLLELRVKEKHKELRL
mmetsp:Transcript_22412/g.25772  ORF Transcript_22412/g.25772 Transcript_22412/m.25772 type:complete len:91 (+) Transcript_22412:870-1142(+)